MLAKLMFAILVFAFGVSMFGAGVQAPPAVSEPVARVLGRVALSLRDRYVAAERWAVDAAEQPPALLTTERYSDLLLTSSKGDTGAYGVQVGLYAELAAAERQAQRVRDAGQAARLVAIGQQRGSESFLVAAGPFASLSEARSAARELRSGLLSAVPLVPLRLPVPPAAAPPVAAPLAGASH